MRAVTVYESRDGVRHETAANAAKHERLLTDCELAEVPLGPRPTSLGEWEYVQHTEKAFNEARSNILKLLRDRYDWAVLNNPDNAIHPGCIIGRMLDDSRCPLYWSWSRLGRISTKTFREYNQPYFANNEDQAQKAGC